MPSLIFYRQQRRDGAVRMGVERDDVPLLEHFDAGQPDWDAALDWFIDVRMRGDGVPDGDPEQVRRWLVQAGSATKAGLEEVASELSAGIDKDWPVRRSIDLGVPDVIAEVVATCVRRIDGPEFAVRLRETARRWEELLATLTPNPALSTP